MVLTTSVVKCMFLLFRNDYQGSITNSRQVSSCQIDKLEHVTLRVAMYTAIRGNVAIRLTSPSGFRSTMMKFRPLDNSTGEYYWDYTSVQFWGEGSRGTWNLELADTNSTG